MYHVLEGKTVLVTGGHGFIGRHLIERLQKIKGIKIVALTRSFSFKAEGDVRWLRGDLQELTVPFWKKYDVQQIDYVFHLGAFIPKSASDANNIEAIFRDNLLGTRNLLDSLPNTPERILFASTVDVYAIPNSEAGVIDEKTSVEPASLYGSSKLLCEWLVKCYASQAGSSYVILRYGHIYGPGEIAYRKFIPEIIRKYLVKESPKIFGDGSTLRDFLYVNDAVEATLRAAVHASRQLGPINVVSGQSITLREIVECLAQCVEAGIKPDYLLDKPNGSSMRFDSRLMEAMLGKWDLMPLTEGLQNEYAYFKQLSV